MTTQGIHLCWITVKDFTAALQFYTEVVGLKVEVISQEHGWAELKGKDGCILGICKENREHGTHAGMNATITITVDDIEEARNHFLQKGATLIGEIIEIPGHVKMQSFKDKDGNFLQLAQKMG